MDTKYTLSLDLSEQSDGSAIVKFIEHHPQIALGVLIVKYKADERHLVQQNFDALSRMPNYVRDEAFAALKYRVVHEPIIYVEGEIVTASQLAEVAKAPEVVAETPAQVGFDFLWG